MEGSCKIFGVLEFVKEDGGSIEESVFVAVETEGLEEEEENAVTVDSGLVCDLT